MPRRGARQSPGPALLHGDDRPRRRDDDRRRSPRAPDAGDDGDGGYPNGRTTCGGVPSAAGAAVRGGGVEGEMRAVRLTAILLVALACAGLSSVYPAYHELFYMPVVVFLFSSIVCGVSLFIKDRPHLLVRTILTTYLSGILIFLEVAPVNITNTIYFGMEDFLRECMPEIARNFYVYAEYGRNEGVMILLIKSLIVELNVFIVLTVFLLSIPFSYHEFLNSERFQLGYLNEGRRNYAILTLLKIPSVIVVLSALLYVPSSFNMGYWMGINDNDANKIFSIYSIFMAFYIMFNIDNFSGGLVILLKNSKLGITK